MASTPAFNASTSVSARCFPFGRMHPRTKGVWGNMVRAVAVTLAISLGVGGCVFAMAVPWMGMKEIMTTAEGVCLAIMLRAANSPFNLPWCSPTITWGTKSTLASCRACSDSA